MAATMVRTGILSVLPDAPPYDAPPEVRAAWCSQRARECTRVARSCKRLGLPNEKWAKAALLFRAARQAWRARAMGTV